MRTERDQREGRLLATMINMLIAGMSDPSRLGRGRIYAKQGAVIDLVVESGMLTAAVQGSRSRPYEVTVHVAGADTFDQRNALVPERGDIRFSCTCPDWDDPCKHAVAVMVSFADEISEDPTVLVRWRGGDETSAGANRAVVGSRAGGSTPSTPSSKVGLDDDGLAALTAFLGTPIDLELAAVSGLRGPVAAWGELWAEMLTAALDVLTDEVPPTR